MKIKTTVAALSILSVCPLALSPLTLSTAIRRKAAGNRHHFRRRGSSSPMDMHEMLNKKAQEEGASSYRIIEARTGDHWHATAELYK
jgi:hypothetical protein